MKEDLLKQLLESVLGKSKSARGGDEAVFSCPSPVPQCHREVWHINENFRRAG